MTAEPATSPRPGGPEAAEPLEEARRAESRLLAQAVAILSVDGHRDLADAVRRAWYGQDGIRA